MFNPANELSFRLDVAGLSVPLKVMRFSGKECISQPFTFEVDVSPLSAEEPDRWLFCTAFLDLGGGPGFHGQIQAISLSHVHGVGACWRLRLAPRLLCLGLRTRRRLFPRSTAPEIIARVLEEHGIDGASVRFELCADDYPKREFCLQYGETDLRFLLRLCAQEGIHFHFRHSRTAHVLVFADGQGSFRRQRRGVFRDTTEEGVGVSDFEVSFQPREGRFGGRSEQRALGESDLVSLRSGSFMPLVGHPCTHWNHLWLLTEIEHQFNQGCYYNRFSATPWEVAFLTGESYPKPCLPNLYSGQVVEPPTRSERWDGREQLAVRLDDLELDEGEGGICLIPIARPLLGEPSLQADASVMVGFAGGDPDRPMVMAGLSAPWEAQRPVLPTLSERSANDLLVLLRASHPLILLCRQPSGGSFSRCSSIPCACRTEAGSGQSGVA